MHNEHPASIYPVIGAAGLTQRVREPLVLEDVSVNRVSSGGARRLAAVTGLHGLPPFRAS